MNGDERKHRNDDDYLWDGSGTPDPNIVALEQRLGLLAHDGAPRRRSSKPGITVTRRPRRRWRFALAAAAMFALCAIGMRGWYQQRLQWETDKPWQLIAQQGDVRIDGRLVDAGAALPTDGLLETGAATTTRLQAAGIGDIAIGEGSRLRLLETRTGRHRVELQQGRMWVRVWAPPGQFAAGVKGAEVIDLGCEFLVEVDAQGMGSMSVLSGWVKIDNLRREVLVPQGTRVRVNGDGAAGTPHAFSASQSFIEALATIDAHHGAVDPHGEEVRRLLAAARPQDAISLLTLLRDFPQLADGPMFERLAQLLPTMPGANRDAWRADRMAVLNTWWDALPYPQVKRWWMQWPDVLPSGSGKMQQWLRDQANG
ncbi:MAG: hypothetical protein M3Q51_01170 [Pseudomonadota bacterium]|nr:hypothetical protein [Pseudomonadota bacterium]